jgi:pimeloyl-ACP methyl ester carboxylesterase
MTMLDRVLATAVLIALPSTVPAQEAATMPTNGIAYNVQTWGDPQDPAVVLMHGWMGTSHSWRKLAPLLANDRFVIVPDMRGYGASDKPDTGYDAATLSADVLGVMRHLGIERAHIVGHDMGALVAFVFAGTYPEATLSMTYLDEPLVGFNLDQFTTYREETYGGYWHFGFKTAPGLAELLITGREQEFVDYIVPLMHSPNPEAVTAGDRRIYADSLRAPGGIAGSVGWYRATFETARQMQAIGAAGFAVPVMAWGGEYGVPVTHAQFEAIPGEEAGGIIPGAGHLLPEEVPEFLAAELGAFFDAADAQ